jgi:MFS family permease
MPIGETLRFYRPFLPLFGGIFCCLLGVGASLATVPFFVLQRLHGSNLEAGVAVAALSVAVVVARPVAGRLADLHGYKLIMLCGTVACALAGLGYYAAASIPVLVVVRVVQGTGEGAVYTAGAAWLVGMCPPERRGRVVGLYGIYMWLGITLGALLGTLAMRIIGFAAVWGLCALAGAAGFASASAGQHPPAPAGSKGRVFLLPAATVVPGIALSLASLGYAALAAFVALHMLKRGVADGVAAFNAFGFTYVGIRLFIGKVPDRYGPRPVAIWSALVEAAGLTVVAAAPSLPVVIIGGLIMGAGLSLLFPSLALIVINSSDTSQQGAALGAFTSFWDLGIAVGAPVSGLIAGIAGYPAVYYVMAACAIVSAGLSLARRFPGAVTSPAGVVTSAADSPAS